MSEKRRPDELDRLYAGEAAKKRAEHQKSLNGGGVTTTKKGNSGGWVWFFIVLVVLGALAFVNQKAQEAKMKEATKEVVQPPH
ncbi:MAG: hypothetical protein F6K62_11040 [Sphaerospermopsis sp. SIO1G2]|nr:hypothetical protein [Sphaerospermopsis sp. SIO1G2]